jgi:hypothetical protein
VAVAKSVLMVWGKHMEMEKKRGAFVCFVFAAFG